MEIRDFNILASMSFLKFCPVDDFLFILSISFSIDFPENSLYHSTAICNYIYHDGGHCGSENKKVSR